MGKKGEQAKPIVNCEEGDRPSECEAAAREKDAAELQKKMADKATTCCCKSEKIIDDSKKEACCIREKTAQSIKPRHDDLSKKRGDLAQTIENQKEAASSTIKNAEIQQVSQLRMANEAAQSRVIDTQKAASERHNPSASAKKLEEASKRFEDTVDRATQQKAK